MKKILMVLILLFSFACASKQEATKKERYFWPPLPNDPKIEYLAVYSSNRDFPKKFSFIRWLVGETDMEFVFRKPLSITADETGVVYVTDMLPYGGTIWDVTNKKVNLFTDEGTFQLTTGIAVDEKVFYVADMPTKKIFVYSKADRKPVTVFGDDEMEGPGGMAINESLKRLYVVDTKGYRVVVFDTVTYKKLFSFGKAGSKEGEFNRPWALCVDKNGDLYVSDGLNARVQIFDKDGKFLSSFGKRGDAMGSFAHVKGIGVDSDGNIYVVDPLKAVQIFSRKGELLGTLGAPGNKGIGAMVLPMGLYIDKKDRIYVVDQMNRRFYIFQYLNEEYKKSNPIDPNMPVPSLMK